MALNEQEAAELAQLQKKCLKQDGTPKANAAPADLERINVLIQNRGPIEEPEPEAETDDTAKEAKKPLALDEAELAELARLELAARNGRMQPAPEEMIILGKLRVRAKANKQIK